MEELIFFGVIIFFSIIESISRSRKAKRAEEAGQDGVPDATDPGVWVPREGSLPTYDEEPSYDDAVDQDRTHREQPSRTMKPYDAPRPGGISSTAPTRAPASVPAEGPPPEKASTEMLPGDLLQELAGLAGRMERAQAQARAERVPRQSPELPESGPVQQEESGRVHQSKPRRPRESTSRALTTRTPRTPTTRPDHRIHRSHAGYGTDPSERARSEQDGLDPLATSLGADALAVRRQLLNHDPHALRQALVLQEVLGPPAALANPRFYDDE